MDLLVYLPLFLFSICVAFFIPGHIFISRLRLTKLQTIPLSISLGIILWALQGFLFGYLNIRWATYIYILLTTIIWLKNRNFKFVLSKITIPNRKDLALTGFIFIIVCLQLLTIFANGIQTNNGIYFCCNIVDNFFHVALTNELITHFPPSEVGISNVVLHNYHFLPNLVNADLIRIFHIPLFLLQFPYTSVLVTILFVLNIVTFSQLTIKKRSYTFWLLFFSFFSGDLLFILSYIYPGHPFFLHNPTALWVSPPRVYGTMELFAGLCLLTIWFRNKRTLSIAIPLILTFGSLIGFKVYFGIFALVGLAGLALYSLLKRDKQTIGVIILTFFVSLVLYVPINSGAGGLVFTGFWRFEDFAAQMLPSMELARYTYLSHNNSLRLLQYELIYIVCYFAFTFGTLILAIIQTKKSLTLLGRELNIFMFTGIAVCLILGSFFIQKTGGANSSQFLITVMIMISIYTALSVYYWLQKINGTISIIIAIIIILFTIPTSIAGYYTFFHIVSTSRGFLISTKQERALEFLKNHTPKNSVILQSSLNYCLYIPILSQRKTYICTDGAPSDRGVNIDSRIKVHNDVYLPTKKHPLLILDKHKYQYLYLPTTQYNSLKKYFNGGILTKVYQNQEITILKVK